MTLRIRRAIKGGVRHGNATGKVDLQEVTVRDRDCGSRGDMKALLNLKT